VESDELIERLVVGIRQMVETGAPPMEYIADDFVWDMSGDDLWVERQEYVGKAGMMDFIRGWRETWEDWNLEVVDSVAVGENVAVLSLRQSGRAGGSGVPVEMDFAQVWIGEDGIAKRMIMCQTFDDALDRARALVAERETAR
jgi:hypothetical protein